MRLLSVRMSRAWKPAAAGGLALLAVACASTPVPNPRLDALGTQISAAYSDPDMVRYASEPLAQAQDHYIAAVTAWNEREPKAVDHHTIMADTHLQVARTRLAQSEVTAEIAALAERREGLRQDFRIRTEQDPAGYRPDTLRDVYEIRESDLGPVFVISEGLFETGNATLRSGAAERLRPLIDYLVTNEEVQVRIEGHTDNQGARRDNELLSMERADAVAYAMSQRGVTWGRMETTGLGESRPIATNDTVLGRARNRRVEITLIE